MLSDQMVRRKRITDETKEAALEEMQPGFIVERHLMDGDIASIQ